MGYPNFREECCRAIREFVRSAPSVMTAVAALRIPVSASRQVNGITGGRIGLVRSCRRGRIDSVRIDMEYV